jgi:hypothetical protein
MKRIVLCTGLAFASSALQAEWENPADRYVDAYKQYTDAACPLSRDDIRHFVYFSRDREMIRDHPLLENPRFAGAQVMYAWSQLEGAEGQYDFSIIEEDLAYLASHGKALFVQLQDATFSPQYKAVPAYLQTKNYGGGLTGQVSDEGKLEGWVARRWDPRIQERFSALLSAMGEVLDTRIEGINLQESAIGVSKESDPSFNPEGYTQAIKARMRALKDTFPRSVTMQYANFMPGEWLPWEDQGYLRSIYSYGEEIGVGLGAPDLMVRKRGQLNHALALMHEHDYRTPLGIAVQDGNYIGQTNTHEVLADRENLVPMLHAFARDFLEVDYIFWVDQEPYFEQDVLPCFDPGG